MPLSPQDRRFLQTVDHLKIFLVLLAVAVFGFAMISPSLASLLSLHTPAERQGEVLGTGQSGLSLSRIFGPYVGMSLFGISDEMPYWMAGSVMGAAFVASLFLPAAPGR